MTPAGWVRGECDEPRSDDHARQTRATPARLPAPNCVNFLDTIEAWWWRRGSRFWGLSTSGESSIQRHDSCRDCLNAATPRTSMSAEIRATYRAAFWATWAASMTSLVVGPADAAATRTHNWASMRA